jgi:hypothetical protein
MTTTGSIPEQDQKSEAVTQRIRRGLKLWEEFGDQIEWVAEDRCKVPSCRRAGRHYLVILGPDGERCGCPDYQRNREKLALCKHTTAALISWSKRSTYRVEKRHNSLLPGDEWLLIEHRAGHEELVGAYLWIGQAYLDKWTLEGS